MARREESADSDDAVRHALETISDDDGGVDGVGAQKSLAEAEDRRVFSSDSRWRSSTITDRIVFG